MGFCINCEKCKRLYDTNYFPEFCPYCYSRVDKAINALAEIRNKTLLIRSQDNEYNIGTLKHIHMIAKDALGPLDEEKRK